MSAQPAEAVPDIDIGRVYGRCDPECDVHYETFGRLSDFFGRDSSPHRHCGFFQVHLLVRGRIHLNLDEQVYAGKAPLLIFTPPAVPHSFYAEEKSEGHVLTVRQEVVRKWYLGMPGQWPDTLLREAVFLELAKPTGEYAMDFSALLKSCELLHDEFRRDARGHSALLLALGECFFIHLGRLLKAHEPTCTQRPERSEDLRLFLRFCDLIEIHFRDHLTLTEYAKHLAVTEARLNDICHRMVARPSKEVVHERLKQEACRLLRYSAVSISEISYQLGFADTAYFSRYFTKRTGMSPSQYRLNKQV